MLRFAGYAALFGERDAGRDVIRPGAFARTLAERQAHRQGPLPLYWQHRPEQRIGWVERIAEDEKIEAGPEDYDTEIELIADQTDETPRRVRARLEKKGLMDTLRNQIVERKVIGLIEQNAEVRDVPYVAPKDQVVAVNWSAAGAGKGAIPDAEHDEGVNPATIGKTKD